MRQWSGEEMRYLSNKVTSSDGEKSHDSWDRGMDAFMDAFMGRGIATIKETGYKSSLLQILLLSM